MNTLPDKFGLNDGDNIVGETVDVEGRGEGDHHRHRHNRQDIHDLDKRYVHKSIQLNFKVSLGYKSQRDPNFPSSTKTIVSDPDPCHFKLSDPDPF